MTTIEAMILAATAIAAVPVGQAHAPVPTGNIAQWFGAEAYPPEAMRANEQGRVRARIAVDPLGKPTGCTVTVSSGSFALDSGTCDIAMQHLSFTPAADEAGRAIAGAYPFSIVWLIPKEVNAAPLPVTFVGRGETTTCSVRIDGASRRLKSEACRSLAKAIVDGGGRLDRPNSVPVPPEALEGAAPR